MIPFKKTKIKKNNVVDRFLPIPETVLKGLEPEPRITDFTLLKKIGTGSFGNVFLAQHNLTQAKYAIKAIDKRIKDNIEEKPYFRRELEIMYQIHHPNVVKLFGHFEDNTYCYFVMEYISRGNLYDYAPKNGVPKISTKAVASLIKDVISALYYLHHMNPPIMHRDIKPENILIDNNMRAKLSDFGWSNYLKEDFKRTTICGTPIYLAPEIINGIGHDEKIDIWCVGVLIFELITGEAPWEGDDINTVKRNISQLKIRWPKKIDKDAADLIKKILRYMPEERPSLRTILMHPFFTKFYPDAVNCLIPPNSNYHRLYLISKDHPLIYSSQSNNSDILFNGISQTPSINYSYSNISSLNQSNQNYPNYSTTRKTFTVTPLNSSNFPKNYFIQTRTTGYSVTPSNSIIYSIPDYNPKENTYTIYPLGNSKFPKTEYIQTRTGYSITPSNSIIYPITEYNSTRNTFTVTPLNSSYFPKKDFGENRISLDNNLTSINNIWTTDFQSNDKIVGLVRTTEGWNKSKKYTDNSYQNIYNNIYNGNYEVKSNPIHYSTREPSYYSYKNLSYLGNSFKDNNNYNYSSINNSNNKYGFSISNSNNLYTNLNDLSLDNFSSLKLKNDPDIIRWKQEQNLRRESERIKMNNLLDKYGMSLNTSYKTKYNFI